MKVTSEFIEMGLYGSTLNKAQFKILGQSYPPTDKWKSLVIGMSLSIKDTNLFLLLKGKLALKAQEQITRNYQLLADFHKQSRDKSEEAKKEETPKEEIENKKISKSNTLTIYCDGACKNNPGKAGSGLAIYEGKTKPTLLYGEYEARGTNNTAELNALYKAMLIASESKLSKVTIYSDSKYSIDSITNWAYGWKRKGWIKKSGEIKNLEIIKIAHQLYENIKNRVDIKHVKGHSGVEGNELADRMAVHAIISKNKAYLSYKYDSVAQVLKIKGNELLT
jgi:ribonuclease HI